MTAMFKRRITIIATAVITMTCLTCDRWGTGPGNHAFAQTDVQEKPDDPVAEESSHDHVAIVLDLSGSMLNFMSGTRTKRLDVAKQTLIGLPAVLPSDLNVGLLVFTSRNESNPWVYPLVPLEKSQWFSVLNSMPAPGGPTPTGEYLKRAADYLLSRRQVNANKGTYAILLITDGQPSDESLVDDYLPEIKMRGIRLGVIAMDMSKDHQLQPSADQYQRTQDRDVLDAMVPDMIGNLLNPDEALTDIDFDNTKIAGIPSPRITPAKPEAEPVSTPSPSIAAQPEADSPNGTQSVESPVENPASQQATDTESQRESSDSRLTDEASVSDNIEDEGGANNLQRVIAAIMGIIILRLTFKRHARLREAKRC